MNIEDRLLSKCYLDDNGCWIFTGGKAGAGYGVIHYNGKQQYSHRVSWQLYCGPIENGKLVLHTCDVPACCNPEHLFLGTSLDNVHDMMNKGRKPPVGTRKLTADQVKAIRYELRRGISSYSEIAEQFDVTSSTIYKLANGQSYQEIP